MVAAMASALQLLVKKIVNLSVIVIRMGVFQFNGVIGRELDTLEN
jgi:hypothetical protein